MCNDLLNKNFNDEHLREVLYIYIFFFSLNKNVIEIRDSWNPISFIK